MWRAHFLRRMARFGGENLEISTPTRLYTTMHVKDMHKRSHAQRKTPRYALVYTVTSFLFLWYTAMCLVSKRMDILSGGASQMMLGYHTTLV